MVLGLDEAGEAVTDGQHEAEAGRHQTNHRLDPRPGPALLGGQVRHLASVLRVANGIEATIGNARPTAQRAGGTIRSTRSSSGSGSPRPSRLLVST